jgi:hypothetical protein
MILICVWSLSTKRFMGAVTGRHFLGKTAGAIIDPFSVKDLLPVFLNAGDTCG